MILTLVECQGLCNYMRITRNFPSESYLESILTNIVQSLIKWPVIRQVKSVFEMLDFIIHYFHPREMPICHVCTTLENLFATHEASTLYLS